MSGAIHALTVYHSDKNPSTPTIIELSDLQGESIERFREIAMWHVLDDRKFLIIEIRALDNIDAAGIRALASVVAVADEFGCKVGLVAHGFDSADGLKVAQLQRMLTVFPTLHASLHWMHQSGAA